MTTTPVSLLFADCDLTLITFDAEAGYSAAADALRNVTVSRLLEQYKAIHANAGRMRQDVVEAFHRHLVSTTVPEEAMWSRFAAFILLMETQHKPIVGLDRKEAQRAVDKFWDAIRVSSRVYDDVTPLMAAAWRVGATVQPITSSDVYTRCIDSTISYNPEHSSKTKAARIEAVLGRFMPPVIVFEEFRKASEEGWRRYVRNYSLSDIANAAIIGDSLSDIAAGVTVGMPMRILIDRDGKYTPSAAYAAGATHIVRSLEEVPAILGWC